MIAASIPALAILIAVGVVALLVLALVLRDSTRRRFQDQMRVDTKTRAPNRAAWDAELARELARSKRHALPLSLALVDLAGLPDVNRRAGREQGDAALVECARTWRAALREEDFLARQEGKRFAVLLPHCGIDEAGDVVAGLRTATPTELRLTVGLVAWDGRETAAALETRADQALQRDKRRPRFASRANGDATGGAGTQAPDLRTRQATDSAWR
jgi:diguanylate cyclase (GGDEF)-like protein